jgi:hypothetical protein
MTALITLTRIIEIIDNSSWRGACPPDLATLIAQHIASMI